MCVAVAVAGVGSSRRRLSQLHLHGAHAGGGNSELCDTLPQVERGDKAAVRKFKQYDPKAGPR